MSAQALSLDDQVQIAEQLRGLPANVLGVAARCPAGHPSVIKCYPLRREAKRLVPFPTMYWLTCPQMCVQLSHLERDGAISVIAVELKNDPVMQAEVRRDHEDYIAKRWAMLSTDDQRYVSEHRLLDSFQSRGIGGMGMGNLAAIKCLHLHVAHHLASGSTIGEWILKRFDMRPCETNLGSQAH